MFFLIENLELIFVGFPCAVFLHKILRTGSSVMPPQQKRKSVGGESGAKAKAAKAVNGNRIVVPVEFQDCVKKITGWFTDLPLMWFVLVFLGSSVM